MKVLFVFKVFVFLSTNALATVHEDRFISAEFLVNSVFIYDQAMVRVIVSFVIFRHDISRPSLLMDPIPKDTLPLWVSSPKEITVCNYESRTYRHPRPAPDGDRQTPCCP